MPNVSTYPEWTGGTIGMPFSVDSRHTCVPARHFMAITLLVLSFAPVVRNSLIHPGFFLSY